MLVPDTRLPTAVRTVRQSRCRAVLVAAVVYTVVVTVLATWRGPGISPDSVAYVSAANGITETGTLTMFDGGYLRFFPPGLPLTLAGLSLLGLPLGLAATLLNCLAASGTVVVTERIAARATGSPVLAAACAVTLAVSMGFVSVNAMLWTEPFVGLTTAVWILLLQRMHANGGLTRADVAALVLSMTVSYTYRYAAIFMLAATVLMIAVVYWRLGRGRAIAVSGLVAGMATIGLAVIGGLDEGRPALLHPQRRGTRRESGGRRGRRPGVVGGRRPTRVAGVRGGPPQPGLWLTPIRRFCSARPALRQRRSGGSAAPIRRRYAADSPAYGRIDVRMWV